MTRLSSIRVCYEYTMTVLINGKQYTPKVLRQTPNESQDILDIHSRHKGWYITDISCKMHKIYYKHILN